MKRFIEDLREVAIRHGVYFISSEIHNYAGRMPDAALAELLAAAQKYLQSHTWEEARRWIDSIPPARGSVSLAMPVGRLLVLLDELAATGPSVFSTICSTWQAGQVAVVDWDELPEAFQWMRPYVERFGWRGRQSDLATCLEQLSSQDWALLAECSARLLDDSAIEEALHSWLQASPQTALSDRVSLFTTLLMEFRFLAHPEAFSQEADGQDADPERDCVDEDDDEDDVEVFHWFLSSAYYSPWLVPSTDVNALADFIQEERHAFLPRVSSAIMLLNSPADDAVEALQLAHALRRLVLTDITISWRISFWGAVRNICDCFGLGKTRQSEARDYYQDPRRLLRDASRLNIG